MLAFDELEQLEDSLPDTTKQSLLYIAGYVTRKDEPSEEDSFIYYEKHGHFQKELDRGKLTKAHDKAAQWTCLCYALFAAIGSKDVCRLSLAALFHEVSEVHLLGMNLKHSQILSNILLKIHCKRVTPLSRKEANLKMIKLSEE